MKKKRYKIFGAEILKGYCPVCVVTERLGSRRGGRRWVCGHGAGVRDGRAGAGLAGAWALGAQGERAHGRGASRRAGAGGRAGSRHAGRRAGRARGRRAAAVLGRAGDRGAEALGCWGVRALVGARQGERARLGARCARGTAGRQHGRAACARKLGQLGQVGVLCILARFLDPVRLGIFPESPNEHCSL